ncbi:MAG: shikimate kinase [Saprospiraceae bacterium]|nr:shikimate kinase [Saprospiraceae bacterium]
MLIFLVGMTGSGKTTLGELLAERLGISFYDTDEIIASMEDLSVDQIFEKFGEEYFRNQETELITHWKIENGVVATGGGLPCHDDLMDVMSNKGVTIHLQANIELIIERLKESDNRPLIKGQSTREMTKTIKALLHVRNSFYKNAAIKIKNTGAPDEAIKRIFRKL